MQYIYYNLTITFFIVRNSYAITFFATRFGTDDLAHRILTLLQMMGAAAMAVNVTHGLGETGFALYAAIRSLLVIEYIHIGRRIPLTQPLTEKYSIGFALFVPPPL
jgi:low temperature requirement protein LtrA